MNYIITGHGHFSTGLQSSVKLITGLGDKLAAIDFEENMSSEDLKAKLVDQLNSNGENEQTIIFTDIAGGTPFNQSVLLKNDNDNIEVIAGTNLPILVEAVLSQERESEPLSRQLVDSGKNNIKKYEEKGNKKSQDFDSDDGI